MLKRQSPVSQETVLTNGREVHTECD